VRASTSPIFLMFRAAAASGYRALPGRPRMPDTGVSCRIEMTNFNPAITVAGSILENSYPNQ